MDILKFLELGKENTAAIKSAGKVIGGLSAVMSFGPAAGAVNQVASALGLWDQEKDVVKEQLRQVHKKLDLLFNALFTSARLLDDNERRRDIIQRLERIRVAAENAENYNAHPGEALFSAAFEAGFRTSLEDVRVLQSNEYFSSIYDEQLIYDSWKGPLKPPGSLGLGNTAWSYRFILPALLEGIVGRLLVIGVAYDNSEAVREEYRDYQDEIDGHAKTLIDVHNKIQNAIKRIPRPKLSSFERVAYLVGSGRVFYGAPGGPGNFKIVTDEGSDWAVHDRPYGAVECYSAVAKQEPHPRLGLPDPPTNTTVTRTFSPAPMNLGYSPRPPRAPSQDEIRRYRTRCLKVYNEFALKHTLRTYRKQMEVYVEVGLPSVWENVLDLKKMAGKPSPKPSNNLAGWSVRDIARKLSPWSRIDPDRPISVRKMATLFDDSPPASLLKMLKV